MFPANRTPELTFFRNSLAHGLRKRNKTVIQEVLNEPSVHRQKSQPLDINAIIGMEYWRAPFTRYIRGGELASDLSERTKLKRRACSFTLVEGTLYKRGFITLLIKCLGPDQT